MAGLIVDPTLPGGIPVNQAEARIGRPATPASVAGVARRTTRRTVARHGAYYGGAYYGGAVAAGAVAARAFYATSVYVPTLPVGCTTTVVIGGYMLYHCGGTYYQAQGNQYVIVEVD